MTDTKAKIRSRIRVVEEWITPVRTLLGAAVAEGAMRFVLKLDFTGDQQQNRTVNIEKLEEDAATYTMKFSNVPVAPAALVTLPPNYDIEQPLIVLQGGSSLYCTVSGNSLQGSVTYWDDVI